ncbi:hypothetical protein CcCBS67573_g04186 [Chytriomyces confervae]|uniref:N-acetyltransferase domain-containing protein n=1 Tax=Chytriomyces confervae TaxID=246404 RepID=A0A507FE64_9FUNG|nr:hypothetical protein CcCBS67573_g04186 [Chytriomyces confervae]
MKSSHVQAHHSKRFRIKLSVKHAARILLSRRIEVCLSLQRCAREDLRHRRRMNSCVSVDSTPVKNKRSHSPSSVYSAATCVSTSRFTELGLWTPPSSSSFCTPNGQQLYSDHGGSLSPDSPQTLVNFQFEETTVLFNPKTPSKTSIIVSSSALFDHMSSHSFSSTTSVNNTRMRRRNSKDFSDPSVREPFSNMSRSASALPALKTKMHSSVHSSVHLVSSHSDLSLTGSQPVVDHLLPQHRKAQHAKSKQLLTLRDLRSDRVRSFFRHGMLKHDERVFQNRGLWLPPPVSMQMARDGKWNLGNMLHITDKYIPDLDMDLDQSIPSITATQPFMSPGFQTNHKLGRVSLHTLQMATEKITTNQSHPFDHALFSAASSLVTQQFAQKNVSADLDSVLDDSFSVDIATTGFTSDTGGGLNTVLGAIEYVFMRGYLWIEAVAVHDHARRCGVGRELVSRVKEYARVRGKKVLCFGLLDVCGFYEKEGFQVSPEFAVEDW